MKKFAVFGNPINHSLSPRMHNAAFLGLGIDAWYDKILLENAGDLLKIFHDLKLNGANITLPFKKAALNLSDVKSELSQDIGAANTIIQKENKIHCFNTDAQGFLLSVKDFDFKNALIIGAGATAKTISYILNKNAYDIQIVNRSDNNKIDFEGFSFSTQDNLHDKNFDLIINTTPAGLVDRNFPIYKELLEELFANAKFAFDVIYGKNTPFLELAKKSELNFKDGLEMLVNQAALSFNIFCQSDFDLEIISKMMLHAATK